MDKRTIGPAKCIAYVKVTNITGIRSHPFTTRVQPFTVANLQLAEHSQCTDFLEYEVRPGLFDHDWKSSVCATARYGMVSSSGSVPRALFLNARRLSYWTHGTGRAERPADSTALDRIPLLANRLSENAISSRDNVRHGIAPTSSPRCSSTRTMAAAPWAATTAQPIPVTW